MNTARLKELLDRLLAVDQSTEILNALGQAADQMQSVVNNPGDTNAQTQYASAFQRLRANVQQMLSAFTPAELELMDEIGARSFFGTDWAQTVADTMQSNAVTPAVVLGALNDLRKKRSEYLTHITELRNRLQAVGIKASSLQPGEAELGILLPRALFENNLEGLVDELGTVKNILRIFSEVVTGKVEAIEVRQISTSDPIFTLGLALSVIVAIGKTVTWALQTWKSVEDIRKLRREAQKSERFTSEEIEGFFEKKIEKTIDQALQKKVDELVAVAAEEIGRKHEQRVGIEWALKSILTRIERGMTIEVRFLPPRTPKKGEPPLPDSELQPFVELKEIVPLLSFPRSEGQPVLPLPSPTPPKPEQKI